MSAVIECNSPRMIADVLSTRTHMASFSLPKRRSEGSEATAAAGLVSSTTSRTAPVVRIEIDRHATRAKKLRKSVITGARLHDQEAKAGGFRTRAAMLTTTYRSDVDQCPKDVARLLDHVRGHFNRASRAKYGKHHPRFRYIWVMELTKRLRPHYHLLFWLPKGIRLPKPDDRGWWPHGSTRIEWAKYAVGYMAKYASKFCALTAAHMPKGFRTHAVGGLSKESQRELRWWKAPLDAREVFGAFADIRKAVGGYFDKHTGEFWASPWHVIFQPDGRLIAWRYE
ncbi:MAG: rolling circle replication-associated protein [Lysobacter sp.]